MTRGSKATCPNQINTPITMSKSGQLLINPMTGEWAEIITGTEDTPERRLEAIFYLPVGACTLGEHLHPNLEKRITVQAGEVAFRIAGRAFTAGAGEVVTIPAGVPHRYCNNGPHRAEMRLEAADAERYETLLLNLYGLAHESETDANGRPNRLQLALLLEEFADVWQWLEAPPALRRPMRTILAAVARREGYRGRYLHYTACWVHRRSLGQRSRVVALSE